MTDGRGVVLVFDEGPGAGLGHRRRMEALAAQLTDRGTAPALLATDGPVDARILVIDSYRSRADDRARFRGSFVVAVDDLDRDLAVDLVVDPNPGASPAVHRAARNALAGAEFALVPPLPPGYTPATRDPAAVVLVTTGATDQNGLGRRMAGRISDLLPRVDVRMVVGPWAVAGVPDGVQPVAGAHGLDDELAAADVVVTASGVTMLESLRLGRPTVAVVTADNQRKAANGVERAGAAVVTTVEDAPASVVGLVSDAARRRELSRLGQRLIDGRGPERVVDRMLALCSNAPSMR